jgi:hypothetical protein
MVFPGIQDTAKAGLHVSVAAEDPVRLQCSIIQ